MRSMQGENDSRAREKAGLVTFAVEMGAFLFFRPHCEAGVAVLLAAIGSVLVMAVTMICQEVLNFLAREIPERAMRQGIIDMPPPRGIDTGGL